VTDSDTTVRVVVAEDEAIIRLDLIETLRAEGYDVVADTGRGDQVVDLVRAHEPDVAVLDIKMPGLDGLSAAAQINAEHLSAVVILTAFSQRELIEQASEAGAMAYLVKPFQRVDLVPAIETARARFSDTLQLRGKIDELERRLNDRKLIDRAKGFHIDTHGLTESEAFRLLQTKAMSGRRRMAEVAEEILADAT
jgi:response regulator NasT